MNNPSELKTINAAAIKAFERCGLPVTSSRNIATVLGRSHQQILGYISTAIEAYPDKDFTARNLVRTVYTDSEGHKQPEYLLTRNGFDLLAIQFTGEGARKFFLAYVRRFEALERRIKKGVQHAAPARQILWSANVLRDVLY